MREMECVRQSPEQDKYLENLLKAADLKPNFILWDNSKISSQSPLLLMVDEDHVDALIEVVKVRDLKIIVGLNARRDFKLVSQLSDHFDKIFGFIDLSQEIEYNIPLLKNYVNMNFSIQALSLDKLAHDLNKIHEFTQSELVRVKDLHDRLVRVRVDNLKGITVSSKFMAGEKSGGEFFDLIQTDHQFLFIHAGSNSYILSSLVLNEMELLKQSLATANVNDQVEHFEKMIKHHAFEAGAELNYCIVNIDTKTLQADCRFKGNGLIYYQNDLIDFTRPIKFKMKPSDKFYLLSDGALKNLAEFNPKLSIKNFFKENIDKDTRDFINEFFFEVSRNKAGSFLSSDALMAVVEVEQKVLYQI